MSDLDLFTFFRAMLFVFLTTYSVLLAVSGARRLIALLRGNDPPQQILRLYVSYQLLTIRLRPLRGELVQIAFLLLLLGGLGWAHRLV